MLRSEIHSFIADITPWQIGSQISGAPFHIFQWHSLSLWISGFYILINPGNQWKLCKLLDSTRSLPRCWPLDSIWYRRCLLPIAYPPASIIRVALVEEFHLPLSFSMPYSYPIFMTYRYFHIYLVMLTRRVPRLQHTDGEETKVNHSRPHSGNYNESWRWGH